jgi:hypothetical protein
MVRSEGCFEALRNVHLVETSEKLREVQRDKVRVTLAKYGGSQTPIYFHDNFAALMKSNPHPLRRWK